ncbi:relaxase/mobilization nuclease domain-containing protein [Albibacterium bauzanense]|uniref:Relaxase/mobilization nuclease-like protein n=1 Tax=Albibacterium bauzanense TaxID=653929 RepID=A0A4R1M050_9SPHI|nr:relaxase/mobilization nuclease domain-containing protein [Albibacterium bauzanense]TCK82899.1 relaxase/mobilization nuclease-like protein [Albibacterium bauzanense]
MIGKTLKSGSSFSATVNYVAEKEKAEILYSEGIRDYLTTKEMIEDFKAQSNLNPRLNKCVGHCILSFSKEDLSKLQLEGDMSKTMLDRAKEYLEKVNIVNTQLLIVRHFDREAEGLHMHVIYNRVSNSGRTISDKNIGLKSGKVCQAMNQKYEYSNGRKGEHRVNRHRLRGTDSLKYTIRDAITARLKTSNNLQELKDQLQRYHGISMQFKYAGKTDLIQGVSFNHKEQSIKGSSIGYSYGKLNSIFNENQLTIKKNFTNHADEFKPLLNIIQPHQSISHSPLIPNIGLGIISDLLSISGTSQSEEDNAQKKWKKKRKGIQR